MLTFLNKGFIVTDNREDMKTVKLIEYANIYTVKMESIREDLCYVEVTYKKSILKETMLKENLYQFRSQDKSKTETTYNDILSHWMKYLDRSSTSSSTSLEQKLDSLLSHIDIIPGGTEYDLAKQNFEER